MKLRLTIWATIGHYKYGFPVDDLKKVGYKLGRIGLLPHGYLYPELHEKEGQPEELR